MANSVLPLNVEIVAIGDELLAGRVQDTNSGWLCRQLHEAGLPVGRVQVLPDSATAIREAVLNALPTACLVLTTGGLGPTKDDITKHALATCFPGEAQPVVHQPTLEKLQAWFRSRGRKLNPISATMAEVPANATALDNPAGAAPGLLWQTPEGRVVVAMPGVPFEMKAIFEAHLLPLVRARFVHSRIQMRVFRTVGLPESTAAQLLAEVENNLHANLKLAYNPSLGMLDLRLTAIYSDASGAETRARFEATQTAMAQVLAPFHFADGDTTLAEAVLGLLQQQGATLATAESCTGGALVAQLVQVPGASGVLRGGVVSYANDLKTSILGVKPETLAAVGAVSAEVALQLAQGARQRLGATYALSTTGVAGPDGGTDDKPVGMVWVGLAGPKGNSAKLFQFERDRQRNIARTTTAALHQLWKALADR